MDANDVRRWFVEYLEAFAACGRGERDTGSILPYYGVPLLFTTDDACVALTTSEQVLGAVAQQIDQMRAADYDHSEVVSSEVSVLNSRSALYRWTISRQRRDGSEVRRVTFTDLLTEGSGGRHISAIAVHTP